ncbi:MULTISPECIES: FprA family A-type flavoprotein [Methanosarcina]|uniref:Rubredoxin-oxygen oxidoreductase n=3 Tax=Methanosarcina barkeri TaxID=2208 RepID=A0A0E3QW51_METBA|nr:MULTISPECIES: FprA family A-type flavoprotein [Methanosarcina]AKB55702.1 rubredoxin-oxygen oxidoreductase [Methanosarcina barkeri MS]AKB59176.1 rubredoxin-oxygen oxidoreductase [Methanosarcina barkeri 227]AKJ38862.1 flavoprotein A [Methanosarcina barkeri CM1]OEC97397.1 MBL fold metallo-hydrolase [Methanosarcina sp. A14]
MDTEETGGVVELSSGVYWVGAIDWNGRDFHGFTTPGGTTYNSYLVIGEKTALIDTVKSPFAGEMLRRISQIIDPSKLDYIVVNHMELDHSGSLAELKKQTDAKILITKKGIDILNGYFKSSGSENWDLEVVKTGDQLDLGGKTLLFLEATMLHWPDSMETFLKEDRILFSNDGFGQHIATSKRYDFEVGDVLPEAAEYYANILMPFHMPLLRYLGLLTRLGIEPLQIAPSHGIIWKRDLPKILEAYRSWAGGEVKEKVLVIYDTMWGSTEIMANEIAETVRAAGVEVKLLNLRKSSRSNIMKEMLDAAAFAVGSPTLNNGLFPTVGDFLVYLKGLRPQKKKAVAFGSYGWGGGAVKIIEQELKSAGIEVIGPGLQVKYRPYEKELLRCKKLGEQLVAIAKKN